MSMKVYNIRKPNGVGALGGDSGELDLASGDVLAVTKADSGSDFIVCRALYFGTGGNAQVLTEKGQTVLFKNIPDGAIIPIRCTRVFSTNSTVSDVLAMR